MSQNPYSAPKSDGTSGNLSIALTDFALLSRIRFLVLLLMVISILGCAGSIIGIPFAWRSIQTLVPGRELEWWPGLMPFYVGIIHSAVMAIMYAMVGWHLLRYAKTIRAIIMGRTTELHHFLVRQRGVWMSVACAALTYIAIRVGAAVLGVIVS